MLEQVGEVGDATVLVVDNDPAGSALAMAGDFPADRVRIVHEPVPGIVAARNRALDESREADVLVFIDDDELPEAGWLAAMVATWEDTRAAAVAGPVISTFAEDPDPFVTSGAFFVRRRLPTGTDLTIAASGNLLLDLGQVRALGVRFDDRFAMSGGSDSLFTRELHQRGARMVWCDVPVYDVVPATRANRRWVLQRALRSGNAASRIEIILASGPAGRAVARARCIGRGLVRIAGGSARVVLGVVTRSLAHQAKGARTVARGAGMVSGSIGYTRQEYRRR